MNKKLITSIQDKIFPDADSYSLEHRLMITANFFGIIVAILAELGNFLTPIHIGVHIICTLGIFLFLINFFLARSKLDYRKLIWPFVFLSLLSLSSAWIFNGGINNVIIAIIMNSFMVSLIVSSSNRKKMILALYIFVVLLIYGLNYFYPQLIIPYTSEKYRFIDVTITLFYNFFITYFIVTYVVNNYYYEKNKAETERKRVEGLNFELDKINNELSAKNDTITKQNSQLEMLNETLLGTNKRLSNAMIELEQINNELNKSRMHLEDEKIKSENLLRNIFPDKIVEKLKEGEKYIAEHFEEASIVFIDIVNFSQILSLLTAEEVLKLLNYIFTRFDHISDKYGLEKIKTIGDCYMAVAGVPEVQKDHALKAMQMATEIMLEVKDYEAELNNELKNSKLSKSPIMFRIGLDCGPVVAGIIGKKKFAYDLWGDAVNTASRMESYGAPGYIQVTERFRNKICGLNEEMQEAFKERGIIDIKGKGEMKTYFLMESEAESILSKAEQA